MQRGRLHLPRVQLRRYRRKDEVSERHRRDGRDETRTDDSVDLRDTRKDDPRHKADGGRLSRVFGAADDVEGVNSVFEDGLREARRKEGGGW